MCGERTGAFVLWQPHSGGGWGETPPHDCKALWVYNNTQKALYKCIIIHSFSLKTALLLALASVKRVGVVLAVHICTVLQPGCPCFAGQSPFCLSSNLTGSLDQHCSSPSFAWSIHNYMDARYHLQDDTQATDDPQGSPCAWCILLTPLGLIPLKSWFWVVPRHRTVWLDWFPYKRRYSTQYEWNIEKERTRLLS